MTTVVFVVTKDTHPIGVFYIVEDALNCIRADIASSGDLSPLICEQILGWAYQESPLEVYLPGKVSPQVWKVEYDISPTLLYENFILQIPAHVQPHPLFDLKENDDDLYV